MYEFGAEEQQAVAAVLERGCLFRYMDGVGEVDAFETELAARMRVPHAMMTTSGTAALICGLGAVGVGPGDEVLIPSYGFVADVIAVLAVGAVPVVCDIDESLMMDAADLERRRTSRARAVMPVHMNGFVADMTPITSFAKKYGLAVVEDACQSIGATYGGREVGTIGDAGAFSFNQAKIIAAGEGGALLVQDQDKFERAFILHDPSCNFEGRDLRQPPFRGFPFRANEVSGAIMRAQLRRLDTILGQLRANSARVREALGAARPLRHIPVNDGHGACGNHVAYACDTREEAEDLAQRINKASGFYAFQGIANGHSFFEWDILHERRGSHTHQGNPLAAPVAVQGPDDCARSRDILERTVVTGYGTRVSDQQIEELVRFVSA
jgi:dTDP-4-amino-4,6-dideoxygalactose transaminase